MIDRIGMCTICAKVCHKGHDISYAKYGSFFCDCGAKEDGSCKALTKRLTSKNKDAKFLQSKSGKISKTGLSNTQKIKRNKLASSSSSTTIKFDSNLKLSEILANNESDFRMNQSSVEILRRLVVQIKNNKLKQIEKLGDEMIEIAKNKELTKNVQHLIEEVLMPIVKKIYNNSLLTTNSLLARYYLAKIQNQPFEIPEFPRISISYHEKEENHNEHIIERGRSHLCNLQIFYQFFSDSIWISIAKTSTIHLGCQILLSRYFYFF